MFYDIEKARTEVARTSFVYSLRNFKSKFLFCVQLKSKVADYINLIFFFFALGIGISNFSEYRF